ncbi:hypothetical protein OESDEN_02168, partial [Oesophagostomum dentatum]
LWQCRWIVRVSSHYLRTRYTLHTLNIIGRTLLTCTEHYLLGYTPEGDLILWGKKSGDVVCRIAQHHVKFDSALATRNLIALNNKLVAMTYESSLTFWDLEHKALIRQVELGCIIDRLFYLNEETVLCQCSNTVYRINSPTFHID